MSLLFWRRFMEVGWVTWTYTAAWFSALRCTVSCGLPVKGLAFFCFPTRGYTIHGPDLRHYPESCHVQSSVLEHFCLCACLCACVCACVFSFQCLVLSIPSMFKKHLCDFSGSIYMIFIYDIGQFRKQFCQKKHPCVHVPRKSHGVFIGGLMENCHQEKHC